ncbi:MAG: peptidoglycan editing factor PgeF [bacterium]
MKLPLIHSHLLGEIDGICHGFSTRAGGVSIGIFSSMNCGPFSGDDMASVTRNRGLISTKLNGYSLVTNRQVHGNTVRVIGPDDDLEHVKEADGIVTGETGICIGALGADCAPVLFADPEAMIIGVAHAGWQGALAGVTDAVVFAMEQLGARRAAIRCCIGPAIQCQSYEVGEEFKEKILAVDPGQAERCFTTNSQSGKVHFDLPQYIESRLKASGIEQIEKCDHDTYSDAERFFSYRRTCHEGENQYGRQIGAICLS